MRVRQSFAIVQRSHMGSAYVWALCPSAYGNELVETWCSAVALNYDLASALWNGEPAG